MAGLINASFKCFAHHSPPLHRSRIGAQGWNVLRGNLPLPLVAEDYSVMDAIVTYF